MVLRISTTKIVSRPIELAEDISPETTFISIDTYVETSRKDEFILGNLFDYNGNKISYTWDSHKHQVAALKGKNLNTEVILSANEFLRIRYKKHDPGLDVKMLSAQIIDSLKEFATPVSPKKLDSPLKALREEAKPLREEVDDQDFIYDYEKDTSTPVFSGEFLGDDEEVDDFDEQLALKSQEFLKEHPELKSEMEIVRLLEGN